MELQSELATTTAKWSSDYTGGIIMDPINRRNIRNGHFADI